MVWLVMVYVMVMVVMVSAVFHLLLFRKDPSEQTHSVWLIASIKYQTSGNGGGDCGSIVVIMVVFPIGVVLEV